LPIAYCLLPIQRLPLDPADNHCGVDDPIRDEVCEFADGERPGTRHRHNDEAVTVPRNARCYFCPISIVLTAVVHNTFSFRHSRHRSANGQPASIHKVDIIAGHRALIHIPIKRVRPEGNVTCDITRSGVCVVELDCYSTDSTPRAVKGRATVQCGVSECWGYKRVAIAIGAIEGEDALLHAGCALHGS